MTENINAKFIGNRKIIIELRFDHKPIIADKKGELLNKLQDLDVVKPFHWEMGLANINIWDGEKKEESFDILGVEINRISFISRKIDTVVGHYNKFEKIYRTISKEVGELNIRRIGCRIMGTYKSEGSDYSVLLGKMKKIIPNHFLLENYPITDYRFELIYKGGMYNIGPINDKNDPFVMNNFGYSDVVNHIGFGIDTDNYLTNDVEPINNENLIRDVFVTSLSVEKDLFCNLSSL